MQREPFRLHPKGRHASLIVKSLSLKKNENALFWGLGKVPEDPRPTGLRPFGRSRACGTACQGDKRWAQAVKGQAPRPSQWQGRCSLHQADVCGEPGCRRSDSFVQAL